jgi:phosphotransferase system enzyme I (PtsI)
MVEVPSAVLMAGVLADAVSFLSLGTNDLIQYSLAIDRANEQVAYLYEPLHPAILRMIKSVVRAADRAGIPVSLCGEMAGDPACIPVLLGLGLRELSMNALAIPGAKEAIRATRLEHARQLARELLALGSTEEVNAHLAESEWYARLWLSDRGAPAEEPPGAADPRGAGMFH